MPEAASGHAAFETCGQIDVTDCVESIDDLMLGRVCIFHFTLGRHGVGSAPYIPSTVLSHDRKMVGVQ